MTSLQSSLLVSFALAVLGFFGLSVTGSFGLDAPSLFALGILIGGIVVTLLSKNGASTSVAQTKTLYVGNLPYRANEASVRQLFSEHGQVHSVRLLKDRQTGKRRGFGFVEMAEADVAKTIKALNDSEFQQRVLKVREAKERPESAGSDAEVENQ
ncbi:RNA recognition motif domain-containing protein [Flocculibacter collagenilyticus]|uniref:RNA recognition motif domain-containing protein n=1 Tax=Flocculibacter collagenilyticus TaxID=2744479 RepID=UPI0018F6B6B3|nr:RNA-binding protein [Flocculibacter collagenilyticus]